MVDCIIYKLYLSKALTQKKRKKRKNEKNQENLKKNIYFHYRSSFSSIPKTTD